MILVDSHCHLDMLQEHDEVEKIVERAVANNVKYMQTICTKLDEFDQLHSIAERFDNIYMSVGVHPNEVETLVEAKQLQELSSHKKVIGLGETGLDYYYSREEAKQELQRNSFVQHIKAAQINNLPVIVHTRDAEEDTARIIIEEKNISDFPALIHCFTASKEFAKKMLDYGLYISISGIVTFKNAELLREVVQMVPLDRLLVETDAPYLAPVPKRGKTNEPAYTLHVAESIADIKGIPLSTVADQTTENFFRLFSKAGMIRYF